MKTNAASRLTLDRRHHGGLVSSLQLLLPFFPPRRSRIATTCRSSETPPVRGAPNVDQSAKGNRGADVPRRPLPARRGGHVVSCIVDMELCNRINYSDFDDCRSASVCRRESTACRGTGKLTDTGKIPNADLSRVNAAGKLCPFARSCDRSLAGHYLYAFTAFVGSRGKETIERSISNVVAVFLLLGI